jgi:hypothetical protein
MTFAPDRLGTLGMDNIWHLTKRLHVDLRRQASCV